MKNTPKSHLSQCITDMGPGIVCEISKPIVVVIDGRALLHSHYWSKVGTVGTLCDGFVRSVMKEKSAGLPAYVIFDCYTVRTTKDQAKKLRRLTKSTPDMILNLTSPIPWDNTKFIANKFNKQELITLISQSRRCWYWRGAWRWRRCRRYNCAESTCWITRNIILNQYYFESVLFQSSIIWKQYHFKTVLFWTSIILNKYCFQPALIST